MNDYCKKEKREEEEEVYTIIKIKLFIDFYRSPGSSSSRGSRKVVFPDQSRPPTLRTARKRGEEEGEAYTRNICISLRIRTGGLFCYLFRELKSLLSSNGVIVSLLQWVRASRQWYGEGNK